MSRREDILQNIRRNTRVRYEKPDWNKGQLRTLIR